MSFEAVRFPKCRDCLRRYTDNYCHNCTHHYDASKLKESELKNCHDFYVKENK